MFLLHVPTGLAVFLSKRNNEGWSVDAEFIGIAVAEFFKKVEDSGHEQESMALIMETSNPETINHNQWVYDLGINADPLTAIKIIKCETLKSGEKYRTIKPITIPVGSELVPSTHGPGYFNFSTELLCKKGEREYDICRAYFSSDVVEYNTDAFEKIDPISDSIGSGI